MIPRGTDAGVTWQRTDPGRARERERDSFNPSEMTGRRRDERHSLRSIPKRACARALVDLGVGRANPIPQSRFAKPAKGP